MTAPNETHVLMLLSLLAEQAGTHVSEARLEFVASKVMELGPVAHVCVALEKLVESSRRFPTISEVREVMGLADPTSRDGALMLADRIFSAVSRYGELQPGNVKGAKAIEIALGPAAWELVQKQGGWNAVVDRVGEGGTFKAQLRDAADSYLKCGVLKLDEIASTKLPSYFNALEAAAAELAMLSAQQPQLQLGEREEL